MENTTTETTPELTWTDFRKQVMARASQLIDGSQCSQFKIIGYKYLDIRVILYFHDCNQVFDFRKMRSEVKETSFFTVDKDHENRMIESKQFEEETNRDIPENI